MARSTSRSSRPCAIYASIRRYRAVATGALAALFLVFPLASTFRNSLEVKVQFRNPLQSLTGGDFDSFDQINNAVFYVAVHGTTHGQQLLGVIFFWVPRSIWPNKAVDTGILLAEFRNYSFTNLSAPLKAEFFVNGGCTALALGMVTVGYFARDWDRRLDQQISLVGAASWDASSPPTPSSCFAAHSCRQWLPSQSSCYSPRFSAQALPDDGDPSNDPPLLAGASSSACQQVLSLIHI